LRYASGQTDKQTHTDTLIAILVGLLCSPTEAEVISKAKSIRSRPK